VNRPLAKSTSSHATTARIPGANAGTGRRVAIVGGHTAGHVNTGLAIAQEYQSSFGATSILFIGTPHGFEERLVPPAGYRLETISGAPFVDRGPIGKLKGAWLAGAGAMQARRLLQAYDIELVVGVGSYASTATLLAARQLGIRTAIHEANEQLGVANRAAARFVDRIYLSSPSALAGLGRQAKISETAGVADQQRVLVTGSPLRREILACPCHAPRESSKEPVRILVTGGSLGSAFLNEHAPDLLEQLADHGMKLEVHHQAGTTNLDPVRTRYRGREVSATVVPYFDRIVEQYARSHFAITTAGAITLAELAACGLPALVVPLRDAARDHQLSNASAYGRHTGGLWIREEEWNPRELATAIAHQLRDPVRPAERSQRTHPSSRSHAARKLVESCESMMRASR